MTSLSAPGRPPGTPPLFTARYFTMCGFSFTVFLSLFQLLPTAQTVHRHLKRLPRFEPARKQLFHRVTQMRFQFFDVRAPQNG